MLLLFTKNMPLKKVFFLLQRPSNSPVLNADLFDKQIATLKSIKAADEAVD